MFDCPLEDANSKCKEASHECKILNINGLFIGSRTERL